MKINVDGTFQRITFDPVQNVYIGIQCLDFSSCPAMETLNCSKCPFKQQTDIDLEEIIQVYLESKYNEGNKL